MPVGNAVAKCSDRSLSPHGIDRRRRQLLGLVAGGGLLGWRSVLAAPTAQSRKKRILIVSSYSRDYLWSQSTQEGVNAAMLKSGYLDSTAQGDALVAHDAVESSRAVVRKYWMNTKRHNSRTEIAVTTGRIMAEIRSFVPDLVLLGDDNAANYIGNQLLGTNTPAVFWGINGLPLKYGLIESLDAPGQNITGVFQSGYYKESLDLLKRLVPAAQTFAILSCDSETARPSVKIIEQLDRRGVLPLKLTESIVTNSYESYKSRALAAASRVNAFFVLNHDTLRDASGNHVEMLAVGRWYLENIRIPEVSHEDQFVREGMLLTANDSGFNQGQMAFELALPILERGVSPARIAVRTPDRGPYLVNRNRARQLGIALEPAMYMIDEIIEESVALQPRRSPSGWSR
jgi:putative ABC transport system substrate-binding protein